MTLKNGMMYGGEERMKMSEGELHLWTDVVDIVRKMLSCNGGGSN
jgi:hypothetical protein